ncbi:MAG: FliM/FliN family flagellar motor C-terminal domain-containing protein [Acidobacteriota bacterium]|nr:FliM/FliN family flagellar motor C-terminal domain-containing protein [Acidobacteriota bacterium]
MSTELAIPQTALALGSVPETEPEGPDLPPHWGSFLALPCTISIEVPVPGLTVAMLLRMAPGDVIPTQCTQGSDVPMQVNGKIIGWTEFEVIEDKLASRLTQIA